MKIAVIGGGPSGIIASYACAKNGNQVVLFEKNSKLGKKLYITGKGRCNITNASTPENVIKNTVTNPKFLYTAINNFSPDSLMNFIEELGVKLKIERGQRVFPESDKSSDIILALEKAIKSSGVDIRLNTCITSICVKKEGFSVKSRSFIEDFDAIIIATGGVSYKATGSTGDGYKFANLLGHTIVDPKPALVPLKINEVSGLKFSTLPSLEGLSLKNVELSLKSKKKTLFKELGELVFTHDGMSGPLVLSASSIFNKNLDAEIVIDLKPALSYETLNNRVLRDFSQNLNKLFKNSLDELLPQKIIPFIIKLSKIPENKVVRDITKQERLQLLDCIKNLTFNSVELEDIDLGIITSGGISTKEINPKTMESKIVKNLYFSGEVIDVDAFTGGFNLQIAFSTGYLAGSSIGIGGV